MTKENVKKLMEEAIIRGDSEAIKNLEENWRNTYGEEYSAEEPKEEKSKKSKKSD